MKRFYLLLMLPLLAVTLNSCSKKDDGGESGGENTTKLVKQIVHEGDMSFDFAYDDQKRITKITTIYLEKPNEKYVANISYGNNKVTIDYGNATTILTLDNNGYVTKEDFGDGEYITHEYSNANLAKSTDNDGNVIKYTWDNENMTKLTYTKGGEEYQETYTYGSVENKLNVNFGYEFLDDEFLVFKGIRVKNLPVSHTSGGTTDSYTYTYDNGGYPTKRTNGTSVHTIIYY